MKKITYTFQIESGMDKDRLVGDAAFKEVFRPGLEDALHSVRTAAFMGFRSGYMTACISEAMKLLTAEHRQDGEDAVAMFREAVDCIKSAQLQIQLQHDNDNGLLKDRLEGVPCSGETDLRYTAAVRELTAYCRNFSERAMTVLQAYDALMGMLGTTKEWVEIYATIIGFGEKYVQDVFDEYYLNDKMISRIQQESEADDLIIKWRVRLDEVRAEIRKEEERIRREEEARRERERKLAEERARKEAEERARKEAEAAAERIRREAEEAAERARKEAAERKAREQKEAEERAAYEELAARLRADISGLEDKKKEIRAEYDSVAATLGSKVADQEAEENLLKNLLESKEEISGELDQMRQDRTDKMAKYTRLGVFAGAEKKNLKIDIDRLDIEIAGKESKLNSYAKEIDAVERRVNGRDNGAKVRLKGYQQELDKLDADIAALRMRIQNEKPAHMQ